MRVYIDTAFIFEHSWYCGLGVVAKKIGYVYEFHIELLFFGIVFEYVSDRL